MNVSCLEFGIHVESECLYGIQVPITTSFIADLRSTFDINN